MILVKGDGWESTFDNEDDARDDLVHAVFGEDIEVWEIDDDGNKLAQYEVWLTVTLKRKEPTTGEAGTFTPIPGD